MDSSGWRYRPTPSNNHLVQVCCFVFNLRFFSFSVSVNLPVADRRLLIISVASFRLVDRVSTLWLVVQASLSGCADHEARTFDLVTATIRYDKRVWHALDFSANRLIKDDSKWKSKCFFGARIAQQHWYFIYRIKIYDNKRALRGVLTTARLSFFWLRVVD